MKHDPTTQAEAERLDADLPPAIRTRLERYVALLQRWNSTVQLVSRRDIAFLWSRHIADALQLLPLLPPGLDRAIDLGSGGGLPGLVLAIASGIPFDLVESDLRKAAFLREAAAQTAAPVQVHACRIEAVSIPPAHLITARALAPLSQLLALAHPLLAPGGLCLFPKGVQVQDELDAARLSWDMTISLRPSQVMPDARLLLLRDIRPKGSSS